jgi:hypothetical protein
MGGALGFVVVALAGLVGAPPAERAKAQITYTVRMVEAQGVDWREDVFDRLKPVTRQGAATVWTVPRDATQELLDGFSNCPEAKVVEAPKVTSSSGAAAVIQYRRNRPMVTQTAWNGTDPAAAPASENVRVGWHTTMVGRKLDQGILVGVVFEDTVIRAVHQVTVNRPAEHPCAGSIAGEDQGCTAGEKATGLMAIAHAIMCAEETCTEGRAYRSPGKSAGKDDGVQKVTFDVPEVDTHEVLGEWLIPRGEALLVSFGAYTVADQDGMAVVKERLAIIEADEASSAVAGMGPRGFQPVPVPLASPYASGMNVPPPLPVSPSPGNVSIVPLLPPPATALPASSPAVRMAAPPTPSRSFPQGVHSDGTPAELPPLPADETESDSSSSDSSEPLASPQTKKVPQAKPASEPATVVSEPSQYGVPPIPQTKPAAKPTAEYGAPPILETKPAAKPTVEYSVPPIPETKPAVKPTADSGTNKAEFSLPKAAAAMLVPSLFAPNSSTGFQFLMPVKPLSLKLPFGQKLEFEVVGRVVPETEVK